MPDHLPRYLTIERVLRERIAGMRAGDALPSDAQLCSEFRVSRMTARNAMARLADEGLVVRIPGRGSYVAEPQAHRRADRLMSFSSEMSRRGRVPSSIVVDRQILPARRETAGRLGLREGEPIVVLRRVRCADEEPIALETTHLVGSLSAVVMAADLRRESLHATLARAGITLRRGMATVTAAAATAEDARLLGIARGDALLVERRVITDAQGRAIEATESRYPAGRYAIDVRFDVDDAEPASLGPASLSPTAEADPAR